MDYNCLVGRNTPFDNLWYLDGELGFWDKDLFGNLSMELGNSEKYFGRVELGLDRLEGVLYSSTAHWHSWEQHFGRLVMEFGKVEEYFGKQKVDFGNLEGYFGR